MQSGDGRRRLARRRFGMVGSGQRGRHIGQPVRRRIIAERDRPILCRCPCRQARDDKAEQQLCRARGAARRTDHSHIVTP